MRPMPAIGSSLPQTKRSRLGAASFRVSSCRSLCYGSSTTTTRYGGSQELLEGRTRPKFASHPIQVTIEDSQRERNVRISVLYPNYLSSFDSECSAIAANVK